MASRTERMRLMHLMCQREVDQLRLSLDNYLADSERVQLTINERLHLEGGGDNTDTMLTLLAFDSYMTQLSGVHNLARKFNVHLQLNNVNKCTNFELKTLTQEQSAQMLSEYICNSILREQNLLEHNKALAVNRSRGSSVDAKKSDLMKLELKVADSYRDLQTVRSWTRCGNDVADRATEKSSEPFDQDSSRFRFVRRRDLKAFKPHYVFNAAITFIQSQSDRILFITEMSDDFMKLSQLPHEEFKRVLTKPPADQILGVIFTNLVSTFVYRVVVSDRGIWLIDFGEVVEPGEKCEFYYLPEHIRYIPAQAMKCVLVGVNTIWSNRYNEFLGEIMMKYEFKKTNFQVASVVGNVLELILLDKSLDAIDLASESSESKLHLYHSNDDIFNLNAPTENKYETEISKVHSNSFFDEIVEPEKPKSPTEVINVDEQKIHTYEQILKIYVTQIVTPVTFYAHIDNNNGTAKAPICWRDNEIGLTDRYIEAPRLDEIVYAQYFKDGLWYRAKVKEEITEKKLFRVFYVDFGNTEIVPLCCLAKYTPSDDEDPPHRAVLFRLADVIDLTEDEPVMRHQATETMSALIKNRNILVRIIDMTTSELIVTIVDKDCSHVSDVLVRMGYAKLI